MLKIIDAILGKSKKIMDLGCANGILLKSMAEYKSIDSLVGLELAPVLVEQAREKLAEGSSGINFDRYF